MTFLTFSDGESVIAKSAFATGGLSCLSSQQNPEAVNLPLLLVELRLLQLNLMLLCLNLLLLFLNCVHQHCGDPVVLHTFDFTLVVARNQKWFHRGDILRPKAHVMHAPLFPIERDRSQTIKYRETAR